MRQFSEELTPREWAQYNNDKEMWELQAAHSLRVKELELDVAKLEAKWSSWMKIPITIIMLPVRILFVIPLSIYAFTKQEVPPELWNFLK